MSSFALFTELSMVFVKQNFHILCLCWAPDLRLGDDWSDSVDVFYLTPPRTSFSCFLTRGGAVVAAGTLMLWSGTSAQIRQSERPPEVVGQEGAEPSLGESGFSWEFGLGIGKSGLDCTTGHQSSVLSLTGWQLDSTNQLTELKTELILISLRMVGLSHLLLTFLSVFISRHCQNIQKHSDALTFLHYLLWGQWG